jgi:SAM-dependent methyltransferase
MKLEDIRDYWDKQIQEKGLETSATSFDFQLKNLEVYYISDFFRGFLSEGGKSDILDLGCGTGYLGVVLVQSHPDLNYLGVDYSHSAIVYANKRVDDLKLKGNIKFLEANAVGIDKLDLGFFDVVITERLLINLGSKENQIACVESIGNVLKPGGFWLMLEGTVEGWEKLNSFRKLYGLYEIGNHWTQTKIIEREFIPYLYKKGYSVVKRQCFGMYYFLSRIVHPLAIRPEEPQYSDTFNEIAVEIAKHIPDFQEIGHLRCYILQKD